MSFIYLEVYRVLYPLCLLIAKLLINTNSKIKKGIRMREDKNRVPPWLNFYDIERPILIHCASGEFEYAKPVIKEIKERNPNQHVVVTYFSPSYEGQIKNFPGVDFACPLPWDLPHIQREFLSKLKPYHILISRTDLWPEFLTQANFLKIPVSMFSAALSLRSPKINNFLVKSYMQWLYSHLTHIFCVSDEDRVALSQLISERKITVAGDTRYDQVLARLAKPNYIKEHILGKKEERANPTFIAGSTWPEDEKEIIPVLKDLIRGRVQVMIAPHEPTDEHVARLKKQIMRTGIRPLLYSEGQSWPANQVLIIDQVGILADLYAWADWAFVGGSFRRQVHSVMEPLAHGCKTFFGPYHLNSREAVLFQELGFAHSIGSGRQMAHTILQNRNMDTSQGFKTNLKDAVRGRSGASAALVEAIIRPHAASPQL